MNTMTMAFLVDAGFEVVGSVALEPEPVEPAWTDTEGYLRYGYDPYAHFDGWSSLEDDGWSSLEDDGYVDGDWYPLVSTEEDEYVDGEWV